MNYKIYLYMENNNDDYLYIDLADNTALVNGVEIEMHCSLRAVSAGYHTFGYILFELDDLQEAGIKTVEEVEFSLEITEDGASTGFTSDAIGMSF